MKKIFESGFIDVIRWYFVGVLKAVHDKGLYRKTCRGVEAIFSTLLEVKCKVMRNKVSTYTDIHYEV